MAFFLQFFYLKPYKNVSKKIKVSSVNFAPTERLTPLYFI